MCAKESMHKLVGEKGGREDSREEQGEAEVRRVICMISRNIAIAAGFY